MNHKLTTRKVFDRLDIERDVLRRWQFMALGELLVIVELTALLLALVAHLG